MNCCWPQHCLQRNQPFFVIALLHKRKCLSTEPRGEHHGKENPLKDFSGMLPHYPFSFCLHKTLGVTSSTTPSKDKSENSISPRQCFDKRVPHLTLVWEPVSLMDPLKHYQQGTAVSCLATKYGFEGLFCFGCVFFFKLTRLVTNHFDPSWDQLSRLRNCILLPKSRDCGLLLALSVLETQTLQLEPEFKVGRRPAFQGIQPHYSWKQMSVSTRNISI